MDWPWFTMAAFVWRSRITQKNPGLDRFGPGLGLHLGGKWWLMVVVVVDLGTGDDKNNKKETKMLKAESSTKDTTACNKHVLHQEACPTSASSEHRNNQRWNHLQIGLRPNLTSPEKVNGFEWGGGYPYTRRSDHCSHQK